MNGTYAQYNSNMDSPNTDSSGFTHKKIKHSSEISELKLKILEIQKALDDYVEKDAENTKIIEEKDRKIQSLEDKIRKLTTELLEKDQKVLSLNMMQEKIKTLETEKHFLKKRIEVLVSATNSKISSKPSTPRSELSDNLTESERNLLTTNKCSTPGLYNNSKFTSWTEKAQSQKAFFNDSNKGDAANRILKISGEGNFKDKIVSKEKEISDLINSLSAIKKDRSKTEKILPYRSLESMKRDR